MEVVLSALEGAVADVMRQLIAEVHANLTEATPVDTGWARANWVPSTGAPATGTVSLGSGAADAALASVLAEYKGAAEKSATTGRFTGRRLALIPVFITNNVPYIVRLAYGHSRQAAEGWVQAAVQRASDTIAARSR